MQYAYRLSIKIFNILSGEQVRNYVWNKKNFGTKIEIQTIPQPYKIFILTFYKITILISCVQEVTYYCVQIKDVVNEVGTKSKQNKFSTTYRLFRIKTVL